MKFVIQGRFSLKNGEPRVSTGEAAGTSALPVKHTYLGLLGYTRGSLSHVYIEDLQEEYVKITIT
jgi:hypothetical protein